MDDPWELSDFYNASKFPADLVTFTEEILNGNFHFLCSDTILTFDI